MIDQLLERLNTKYKSTFIFEVEDTGKNIVGFVDDGTFKQIICVIEPTEEEVNRLVAHIQQNGIA